MLMEYGTGAIMAVPGHDERDFEFAPAFELPDRARGGAGRGHGGHAARGSVHRDGRRAARQLGPVRRADRSTRGRRAIIAELAREACGGPVVNYRLHDWCISRQRYWGPPIPIIYCDACGTVPVPESQLPVRAAARRGLQARRLRRAPARAPRRVVSRALPAVRRQARRETDVSDTFLDSAWYFLRYPSAERDDVAVRRGAHEEVAAGAQRTSAATSTPCCTCSTRASSRWCCTTSGSSTSRSRSRGSARTA